MHNMLFRQTLRISKHHFSTLLSVPVSTSHCLKMSRDVSSTPSRPSSCGKDGVYEQRIYSIVPSKIQECVKLTQDKLHLRTAHSELVGMWLSELGGLNQLVHIWYYESLEARRNARVSLSKDDAWREEFLKYAMPTWQKQDNSLLVPLESVSSLLQTPLPAGVYELHSMEMSGEAQKWLPALLAFLSSTGDITTPAGSNGRLLGAFRTVVGELNTAVLLYQYPALDDAVKAKNDASKQHEALSAYTQKWTTKVMLPLTVSPLK